MKMNNYEPNVGKNIAKYRKINGISQKYLAEKLGISSQGLLKIEKGDSSPRANTLRKVIDTLGITPNQLFGKDPITDDNSSLIEMLKRLKQ